jgi:hypothetical protein
MNRHLWHIPVLSIVVLLIATLVGSGKPDRDPDKGTKETKDNYYPLQVGNEWHYQLSVMGITKNMVTRIAKIENIDGKSLARLEAEVDGMAAATSEHLTQTDKGIFRHRNNGMEIDPPICLLRFPAKAGDKWDGKVMVGKEKANYKCETTEEEVQVAAGKFKALKVGVHLEANGQKVDTSYWFAKDVGFVKQTVDIAGIAIEMELQKFQLKKDAK